MNAAIRRLRSEARQLAHGKVPTAIRYPAPFRAADATLTRTQLDQGAAVHRVAGALGLPPRTLTRWLQQSKSSRRSRPSPTSSPASAATTPPPPNVSWRS
jgi:transposase-like protein